MTPAGITTAPAHEECVVTLPEEIVKLPVVQLAFAGVEIKASSSAEMVAARTEYLRI